MKKSLATFLATLLLFTAIPMNVFAVCGIVGHKVIEPTCTEDGACWTCGIIYEAFGHLYNENGFCEYCGEKPELPDLPVEPGEPEGCYHEYVENVLRVPTCNDDGLVEYNCVICGYGYTVDIPATGEHTYDNDTDEYCNVCGAWREVESGECRHQWVNGVVMDPTCSNDGIYERYCILCYRREVNRVPATGEHVYDDDYDAECNYCGEWREVDIVEPVEPGVSHDAVCYNGHYYKLYDDVDSWEEALAKCQARGGYLATITSAEEDRFLYEYTLSCGYDSVYFGLIKKGDRYNWEWCTGEPVKYLNWAEGEPNNQGGYETYGMYYFLFDDGRWNDGDYGDATYAYLCEWGEIIDDPEIPEDPEVPSVCGHKTKREPTCTEVGICYDCGMTFAPFGHLYNENGFCEYCGEKPELPDLPVEPGEPEGCYHEYVENVLRVPTCNDDGLVEYNCVICGYGYTVDIPATGEHTYDNDTDEYCNVCGAWREVESGECRHQWVNGVMMDPTCSNDGIYERYCILCYRREVNRVPATGEHVYDDDLDEYCNVCDGWREVEKPIDPEVPPVCSHVKFEAPTCTDVGFCYECGMIFETVDHRYNEKGVCDYCGEMKEADPEDPDLPCNHEHGRQPTCTEEGFCKDCGMMFAPLGHQYNEMGICDYCGEKEEQEPDLPEIPGDPEICDHQWVEATCTNPAVCRLCGETDGEALEHEYAVEEVKPDCENDGYTIYCCIFCGDTYTDGVEEAWGHDFTKATCTEPATCLVCGETKGEALGHKYDVEKIAPDCVNDGYTSYSCVFCGDTYTDGVIEAWGHDFTEATCTEPSICVVCGETDGEALEHEYSVEEIEPDCENDGYTIYCCVFCGDTYIDDVVEAWGHDFTEATCTEPATCLVCDKTEGKALGHKYDVEVIEPDCDTPGYTTHTCTLCGDSYDTDEVAALGHTSDKGTVTKKATCKATGTKIYTCTVCDEVLKTESIAKIAHTSDKGTVTKKATCTATGTKTYKCTVCKTTMKTESIAKIAHTSDKGTVTKKATCTATGTKTYKCTVCKATVKTETVAKLAHFYTKKVTKATLTKDGSIKTVCKCGKVSSTTTLYKASKISLSKTAFTYNGNVQKPTVTVKDSKGKTIASSNYTVKFASGLKNVGTYKVTITFKGNYSGTKVLTYAINPAGTTVSKVTAGSKKLTVKWAKKTTQVTGYQIQYSTSKSFSSAKTKTISKNSTTSTTLTGLSAKKTYYVRVRTYKTVNGTKIYSGWSTVKTAKTK